MNITKLEWKPEQALLEKLITLAKQRGQSPEDIINETVKEYVETQSITNQEKITDPLIGLFSASPDLATESESILERDIRHYFNFRSTRLPFV